MKLRTRRPAVHTAALAALGCTLLAVPALVAAPADAAAKKPATVKLMALGDDLIHTSVYSACRSSNGYDFSPLFKHISYEAKKADLAVINQETILVKSGYSGYPRFGSPRKVADAVAKAGFNVVTHATNHSMDRGSGAILGTLGYWKSKHPDVKVLGIHKSKRAYNKVRIVKKNGVKIALLNYTYGLNGISLPSGKGYLVDLLTSSRKAKIKRDLKQARKKADFTIVFAHWGTEYRYSPDSSQKRWAKFFADHGVDLVIGAHPHVVEPARMVKGKHGNKMLCYYSLGNFISGQTTADRVLGGMAKVTITKNKKGTRIKKWSFKPTVTHISAGMGYFSGYKLADYTNALARKHRLNISVGGLNSLFKRITK